MGDCFPMEPPIICILSNDTFKETWQMILFHLMLQLVAFSGAVFGVRWKAWFGEVTIYTASS